MLEKGKISAFQLGILLYPLILATAILVIPSVTGATAKRDMFISPVWAALNGLFSAWVGYKLQMKYPGLTLIQYSEQLFGRLFGKILGFVYILFLFHTAGLIVREYSAFIAGSFLPKTPTIVIEFGIVVVCAMAVRGGIEVIARAGQFFLPILIVPLLIMVLLIMKDLDIKILFPIMEHGIKPSLLGATVPQAWFSEVSIAYTMIPFLKNPEKGLRWGVISILAIMVTLVLVNVITFLLLENVTPEVTYPLLIVARYISVADFFEHLESVVMAIWITGIFVKLSIFYYVTVLGTAQLFRFSDYRPLVLPIGWIFVLLAYWVTPSLMYLNLWFATIWPFYGTLFLTVIPLLMWLVSFMYKNESRKKEGMAT